MYHYNRDHKSLIYPSKRPSGGGAGGYIHIESYTKSSINLNSVKVEGGIGGASEISYCPTWRGGNGSPGILVIEIPDE